MMRAAKIEYLQTPGVSGWEVIRVMRGTALLGTIVKRSPQLPYRFFAGTENAIAFEWEHRDLDTLKHLIESSHPPPPAGGA
jgi:hypothetical protein